MRRGVELGRFRLGGDAGVGVGGAEALDEAVLGAVPPDRIRIDRTHEMGSINPVNPVCIYRLEQIHAVNGIAGGDSQRPRSALAGDVDRVIERGGADLGQEARLQDLGDEALASRGDRRLLRLRGPRARRPSPRLYKPTSWLTPRRIAVTRYRNNTATLYGCRHGHEPTHRSLRHQLRHALYPRAVGL